MSSARVSRGCLRCRTRRVKCDEGRPACQRCLKRGDNCVGYRDDADLLFRSENEKASRRVLRRSSFDSSAQSSTKSTSSKSSSISQKPTIDPTILSQTDLSGLNLATPFPWAKSVPKSSLPSAEDQAVSQFFEKYVMYPCNNGSSPGFLEFLPSLFKDCQVEGRLALRWAVRAAAYGSLSNDPRNAEISSKALKCYGLALLALGEALKDQTQEPDDYVLMTVVVLDIFESVYLPDPLARGSHAGGMAQILRLRGPNQVYGARGWSLFRLSHHRLQKQQLAFRQPTLPESEAWLDSLNEEVPHVRIEKNNHEIAKVCERARKLKDSIDSNDAGVDEVLAMIKEMHEIDQVSTNWRAGPAWDYKTIHRSEVSDDPNVVAKFPELLQLHQDVWIAYEWNYHRTGRIILHTHLLSCLDRLESADNANQVAPLSGISSLKSFSRQKIQHLVDEVLSTVPQHLGDIDHLGNLHKNGDARSLCNGIGGYFLLWPIKIIKSSPLAFPDQRSQAQEVFERIRECTGMKSLLGDASSI